MISSKDFADLDTNEAFGDLVEHVDLEIAAAETQILDTAIDGTELAELRKKRNTLLGLKAHFRRRRVEVERRAMPELNDQTEE